MANSYKFTPSNNYNISAAFLRFLLRPAGSKQSSVLNLIFEAMHNEKKNGNPNPDELKLDFERAQKAYFALRAVNHKTRQKMLQLIHSNGRLTVSEIYQKLRIEQSRTSTYLAILRHANLVIAEKNSQNVYYSINYKKIAFLEKGVKIITEE